MDYDVYVSLIQSVDDLIRILDRGADERTREQVVALLGGIDALHREGLERLIDRLHEFGGDALVERLSDDSVVRTLLGLYGFVELDLPEEEPPAPAPEASSPGEAVTFVPLTRLELGRRAKAGPDGGP